MAIEYRAPGSRNRPEAANLVYIGLDLGQIQDFTAVSLVQEPIFINRETGLFDSIHGMPDGVGEPPGYHWPLELPPAAAMAARFTETFTQGRPHDRPLMISELYRFERGTPYDRVKAKVFDLVSNLSEYRPALCIDSTGVGLPVADDFKAWGCTSTPFWFTNGGVPRYVSDGRFMVPVNDLVGAAHKYFYESRIRIPPDLPFRSEFEHELKHFTRRINPDTANESFSAWRERDHDDLLFAAAMPLFLRYFENHAADEQLRMHSARVEARKKPLGRIERVRKGLGIGPPITN